MAAASVLLVTSDTQIAESFRGQTGDMGLELQVAASLPEASKRLAQRSFDVLFVQMDSPDGDVHRSLSNGYAFPDSPPAVAFSRDGCIRDAVDATRRGACQYIVKPPADPASLDSAIHRALASVRHAERSPLGKPSFINAFDGFVTADYRLLTVCETIAYIAPSRVALLVEGESGTGKSLLARMLHLGSPRRFAPFVEFRCALLPEPVVETELFGATGVRRGAAAAFGAGRFELADGGTLVLDDVAGLSRPLQERILRTAVTGQLETHAGARTVDVRLVVTLAGTPGAAEGEPFASLHAVSVRMPALRERVGDILLLADHFLRVFRSKYERPARAFSTEALGRLVRYQWPGNVTELRNAIEHAVILTRAGTVTATALPVAVADGGEARSQAESGAGPLPLRDALREPERSYILHALDAMGWNKQHAAERLQISRSTLYKKMKELGLDRDEILSWTRGA